MDAARAIRLALPRFLPRELPPRPFSRQWYSSFPTRPDTRPRPSSSPLSCQRRRNPFIRNASSTTMGAALVAARLRFIVYSSTLAATLLLGYYAVTDVRFSALHRYLTVPF